MVSRDTAVPVTAVLLAFASLAVLSPFVSDAENPIAALTDPVAVGPVTTDGLLTAGGGVAAGDLFLEARAGYRDSTDGTGA